MEKIINKFNKQITLICTPLRFYTKNNEHITLVGKSVWYYSSIDEDLFFEWIKRIPSIIEFRGISDELHLYIKSNIIPDDDLRELIALFYRYKISMKQLTIFLNQNNKEWFYGKPKGYWHKKTFGSEKIL